MAVSTYQEGTQAASISTEHQLTTSAAETTAGAYQLQVDASALAAGDVLELRIYEKVKAGGTQRLAWMATYQNALNSLAIVSPALMLINGWKMTLKQTAGTGRSFDWSIRKA